MVHDELLRREEAVDRVLELRDGLFETRTVETETETVSLEGISGRTLTTDVVADRDLPPVSRATMDGFAFDAADEYPLHVVGSAVPESEPSAIEAGEAIRIATGAPLPDGANAVLKREDAALDGDELTGETIEPGRYVYERGSNVSAGETLFRAEERLEPRDAILLRDVGIERVPVHPALSAGLLATGTEISEGGSSDLDSPMLAGLVESWGHEPNLEGAVADEYERVEERIGELATEYDVVITTGGTSVGNRDYVVRALSELGEVAFHGVRVRPGKPVAVATLPEYDAVAFAIPGKPIGAHTAAIATMRPFFTGERMLPTVEARLTTDVGIGRAGFEYWVPVTLERVSPVDGDDTRYEATPLGHVESPLSVYDRRFDPSILSSSTRASRADGFVALEEGVDADETIRVVPYEAVT